MYKKQCLVCSSTFFFFTKITTSLDHKSSSGNQNKYNYNVDFKFVFCTTCIFFTFTKALNFKCVKWHIKNVDIKDS